MREVCIGDVVSFRCSRGIDRGYICRIMGDSVEIVNRYTYIVKRYMIVRILDWCDSCG